MWNDLWAALALLMVIEGIVPFISPDAVRRMMAAMAQMDDRSLRMAGLVSMLSGVALLYWVR
ncbi:Putative inner membrane protein YjeT (clustered with HflC) [hydrothermal vent metagenome]|uniref:Inner membrane protein YjeT (Clustered with HflC) n=1 Tax=hydrothermal vent metagenome TaxID=652676 RepID=A0A3B0ZD51_9ZZZZ